MKAESRLVVEIWELVRDQLPASKRFDIATGILYAMQEFGMESKDLADILEEDATLANAYHSVFDIENEADDEIEYDEEED